MHLFHDITVKSYTSVSEMRRKFSQVTVSTNKEDQESDEKILKAHQLDDVLNLIQPIRYLYHKSFFHPHSPLVVKLHPVFEARALIVHVYKTS